jgi:hypothetical protein
METVPKANTLNPSIVRKAKAHADLYGVATVSSLVRVVTALDHGLAHRIAGEFVAKNVWSPHKAIIGGTLTECYCPVTVKRQAPPLQERLAVLRFCCSTPSARPIFDAPHFAKVVEGVADRARLKVPQWQPCYPHRSNATDPERMSLIRVAPTRSLQKAIEDIDEFVSSDGFNVWRCFALGQIFVLTYLFPGDQNQANELSRWIRRRVPVCRIGKTPTPVPVWIYPTPPVVIRPIAAA